MKTSVLRTVLFVLGLSVINTVAAQPAPGKPGAVESGYVEVEGGRIFYEAAGDGPAVVMIHDGLLHRETWEAQFAGFAESHRVIRWDRRGYGRSDSPDAPFRNLDDVFALMTALEIEVPTLIVVGESDIPDVHTHAGVIEAGIEGSRRVVLTHSGHLAHFEVPDAFNGVVLGFLEPIK